LELKTGTSSIIKKPVSAWLADAVAQATVYTAALPGSKPRRTIALFGLSSRVLTHVT